MRIHRTRWWLVLFAISIVVILVFAATVQSEPSIVSTDVKVYRDGLVHVTQTLTLDSYEPQTQSLLLCPNIENLIVLDQDMLVMDYEVDDKTLIMYTFGASKAQIQYDTNTLTSKANEVWTLQMENPYDLTVAFPTNSTVIYLSDAPSSIETVNSQVSLTLSSGQWEISYLLSLTSEQPSYPIPTSLDSNVLPIEYIIIVVVGVVVAALAVALFLVKRKPQYNLKKTLNQNPKLMKDDQEVLQFLAEKGGSAFEAEIRQQFPDMPRTSLWRLVKRLEKLELVEVTRIGLENRVKLKK